MLAEQTPDVILPCRNPHPFFPQHIGFLQNTKPACFPVSCAIHLVFSRHKEQCWIPLWSAALLCVLLGPGAGQSSREELLAVLERWMGSASKPALPPNTPSSLEMAWATGSQPLIHCPPLSLCSSLFHPGLPGVQLPGCRCCSAGASLDGSSMLGEEVVQWGVQAGLDLQCQLSVN